MDPILIKAVRTMLKALPRDPSITADDLEAFLRQQTNNKYGYADAVKYLHSVGASQDPRDMQTQGVRAPWRVDITGHNMGRSFLQGALFNYGDELLGHLVPSSLGGGEGGEEDMRLREDLFHQSHPLADAAGGVAGGIATGLLLPGGEAATAGKALLKGAGYGAAYGGLAGSGAGEDATTRLIGAGVGGGLGAGLGAAVPGGVAIWRSLRDPGAIAERQINNAINSSGGVDKMLEELSRFKKAGKGNIVTPTDLTPSMAEAADFAANANPNTRTQLRAIHDTRQAGVGERMLGDTQDALTQAGLPPDANAEATSQQLGEGARTFADSPAGYAGIEAKDPKFSPADISKIVDLPTILRAWKTARLSGDLKAGEPIDQLLQTITQANPGLSPAEAKQAADLVRSSAINDAQRQGVELNANIQAPAERSISFSDLQQLAQILRAKSSSAWAAKRGDLGEAYGDLADQVKDVITKVVPDYPAVDARYAGFKDLQRLVQEGVDWWNKSDSRLLAQRVQQLSGDPQRLTTFRLGIASELLKQLDNAKTNRNVANDLMSASPAMQRKLETIFGSKDIFNQFMEQAALEKQMSRNLGEAVGGSPTARREMNQDVASIAAEAPISPHYAARSAARLVSKMASKNATREAAGQMGNFLGTQGAPDIEKLLQQWQTMDPRTLSPFAARLSRGAAFGGAQAGGSLLNMF